MVVINITEEQRNNLLVFLSRVDLKGNEAMTLAVIQQVIATAKEPEVEKSPKD
ncbi:hypothetical protein LCGC14_2108270 [marine sediment metagenome]|uniref:Uncharacterized protein n=1 Tax=marine sediment metagenome TaxID=412755 RepID=A0A0F9E7R8_9ZZZZ